MADHPPKQGRGCLFYGCLTTVLVFAGVILGIYFGTRSAVKYAVRTFTTNAPAGIPQLGLPPGEQERVARELEQRAVSAARQGQPLTLGERDLNVLLGQDSQLQPFQTQLYLRPEGTQLQAHVSLPLDQFPLWKQFLSRLHARDLEGRYFNGVALLQPAVTNGDLSLTVHDLLVNGQSLPGEFTSRLKDFNLARQAATNSQVRAILSRVQSVEIRDGQLVIQPAPPEN